MNISKQAELTPDEARAIAADAYVYAYAMLYNHKTMFQQRRIRPFPVTSAALAGSVITRAGSLPLTRTLLRPVTTRPTRGRGSTCAPSRGW